MALSFSSHIKVYSSLHYSPYRHCPLIHDKHVGGKDKSWLLHCQFPVESVPSTDVCLHWVECQGQTISSPVGGPFGHESLNIFSSWASFVSTILNKDQGNQQCSFKRKLSATHCLEIAINMAATRDPPSTSNTSNTRNTRTLSVVAHARFYKPRCSMSLVKVLWKYAMTTLFIPLLLLPITLLWERLTLVMTSMIAKQDLTALIH